MLSPGFWLSSCFWDPGLGSPSKLLRGQELERLMGPSWDLLGEAAGEERCLGLFLGDDRGKEGRMKVPWLALGPWKDTVGSA